MAVRIPTVSRVGKNILKVVWTGLLNGDTGTPLHESYADYADRTVQVEGTFGAGGSVTIEGSNNGGANYRAITDPQGNAITKTAASLEQMMEQTLMARPNVTAGDGTTDLTVTMIGRRTRSGREI